MADFVSTVQDFVNTVVHQRWTSWTRWWISGGLCDYSTEICVHDTGSVADFVSTVQDFVNTVVHQRWTL